ncbi:mitochondrial glutathione transporter SLC25A40 isoform X2 [Paroedura picta]|uniref:mitochondrial glutathione transporter SLC25A40 isoform X2 n=1 Tax=Paroedura picta TaxID=143630 RepID=UPI004055C7B2
MDSKRNGLYKVTPSQQIISSCCGAVITSLLVTPLDVVKIRLQVQSNPSLKGKSFLDSDGLTDHVCVYENGSSKTYYKASERFNGMRDAFVKIIQREGVKTLWSGLPPSLAVSVPTTVIYFTCYDQLRDAFISKLGEDNDYVPLITGGIARLGTATIISPVELMRTRMQSRRLTYKQLHARIISNITKDGWLSLWKGWGPTVLRDVPFSALYWFNYEYFKKRLCKRSSKHEATFLITFSSGAAAGFIAALLTLPFDVVKTHKQTEIWESETTPSIVPRLTKIAPACAIMISTYEYGKSFFRRLNKERDLKNH